MITVGSTVIASKIIGTGLDPMPATALRFAFALPVCFAQALGSVGYTVLLIAGTQRTSAADAGIILGTLPAVCALTAAVVLRERLRASTLAAVGVASLGVALVTLAPAAQHAGNRSLTGGGSRRAAAVSRRRRFEWRPSVRRRGNWRAACATLARHVGRGVLRTGADWYTPRARGSHLHGRRARLGRGARGARAGRAAHARAACRACARCRGRLRDCGTGRVAASGRSGRMTRRLPARPHELASRSCLDFGE
ncbi:EamA family transporter [Paraburkholderia pallida]|uniref:EamA family transporter n=1 Tax=Paraburkholderia pallida TaxID=2547399 RepID=A0A4P7D2D1_9BURK|nr:EamA family transporter [Paraburkholderia pallida]